MRRYTCKSKEIFISILLMIIITITMFYPIISLADELDDGENNNIIETIKEVSASTSDKLKISSRYAVALDRNSNEVIWGKGENIRVPMASTTKIMTAIVLLESKRDLKEVVEIDKKAAAVGGSRMGLKKGDKVNLHDLLYGLMLCSGNDAATQIAISIGGSVEEFAKLMNKKADELNLENSHYVTPHGLDNPEHYTTAYELALLTNYALGNSKFKEVASTKAYTASINGYPKALRNTNELLRVFKWCIWGENGVYKWSQ